MAWASTAVAITSLRTLIKDNPTDKICYDKQVIGTVDGDNLYFKTFEYRRITDFTLATFPQGVFIDGAQIDPSLVASDDTTSGAFALTLTAVPQNRSSIRATYYYQWFTDTELDTFLQNSSTWLGYGSTYINLTDGLNAAALRFAAQEAYEAAAMKYSIRMSEVYKLNDAPSEDILNAVKAFSDMADGFMDKARDLRDDYYTRQGQSLAPNFAFSLGRVTDPTPRR